MNVRPLVKKLCGESKPSLLDVVFVHGLTGSSVETWTDGSGERQWPEWLCEDFPGISIYLVDYPASIFVKWAKKEMDIHERANNVLEQLSASGIGARPIAMICHSLGGILVKEILRISSESTDIGWKQVSQNTCLSAFISTPHTGASLALAVKYIAPRLASKFVDLLANQGGYLNSLNQSYRELAARSKIVTVSYYEKYATRNLAVIISQESADPGVPGIRPVPIDSDHVGICKPSDREDLIYTSLRRHLRNALAAHSVEDVLSVAVDTLVPDDYSVSAESDRRDLHQKLLDAGREYEYGRANDLQNRFARRYHKLGLHTEARTRSDAILADVEQRFITHVYNAKICKGASEDEVAAALQANVIDPICQGHGSSVRSPSVVLQALYFLTEQCFIQWDVN